MSIRPFHVAVPVDDVPKARAFYRDVIGCEEGRSCEEWVDFNFFGHQWVIHFKPRTETAKYHNSVDGHEVPVPHYGVVLEWQQWHNLVEQLRSHEVQFAIEPYIRFKGEVGEQATMFFYDPCGNALEFKAFRDITQLFAK